MDERCQLKESIHRDLAVALLVDDHPVVHISYEDAEAYLNGQEKNCLLKQNGSLAARGGLDGMDFTWGNRRYQLTEPMTILGRENSLTRIY